MIAIPAAVDLWAVRTALIERNELPTLIKMIDSVRKVQSCAGDLREAKTYLEALQSSKASPRRGIVSNHKELAEAAFLSTITMLYVRATAAGSKMGERGSSKIIDHFNDTQRDDHLAICEVRQRALAHVYPDQIADQDRWHHGTVMLVQFEAGWRPAVAANRVQYNGKLLERIKRVLPAASQILDTRASQQIEKLGQMVDECQRNNSEFRDLLWSSSLSLVEFYGGMENAKKALSIADSGPHGHFSH